MVAGPEKPTLVANARTAASTGFAFSGLEGQAGHPQWTGHFFDCRPYSTRAKDDMIEYSTGGLLPLDEAWQKDPSGIRAYHHSSDHLIDEHPLLKSS